MTTSTHSAALRDRLAPLVHLLYPDVGHEEVTLRLVELGESYRQRLTGRRVEPATERTTCLITYGDGIRRQDEAPLHTLAAFLRDQVGDVVSDVHLLPMFPWTSDDGFAVVDHRAINPALGTWADVEDLARDHTVMFDFVANHTSSSSAWFQGWLAGDPDYAGYYVERDSDFDDSRVVRPRTTPAISRVAPRPSGWTPSASSGRSPGPRAFISRRPTPSSSCGELSWTTSLRAAGC
jgi:sucrose phosphorylase